MKAIVVYSSKYGTTQRYAQWIAEALECPAKKLRDVNAQELNTYDTIIYGGGIYAGSVSGLKKFLPRLGTAQGKRLVLFIVGMTNPSQTGAYDEIANRNLPAEWRERFEVFYLRGDQLFSKMSGMHKLMMRMPKAMIEKKPQAERTEEDHKFLESFGCDTVFSNREQVEPILQKLSHM